MLLTDDELEKVISVITNRTGITPRESHKGGIKNFVEKRLDKLKFKGSFSTYLSIIQTDNAEMTELVNESTVNETYFFREEKQFQFLKNSVLPQWVLRNGGNPIRIWCAACSTGEEPYSLALIAKLCKVKAFITASDIDTRVLECCKKGVYKPSSCRMSDGSSFHELLKPYVTEDGLIEISNDIKQMVNVRYANLSKLEDLNVLNVVLEKQNIVFLRNVFIYFNRELRKRILQTIADKFLAKDGYLFVSMSEVASIDSEITPSCLEKQSFGNVFYFRKK